jgi:carbon monoxide dehydrogenase subunit G
MARFVEAIDLPIAPAAAFDLLADFARLPEWDPGAVEARRLDAGPLRAGSRFEVLYTFLGRRLPLRYEIRSYERPHRVVLHGGNESVRSTDEIHFAPRDGGTRVTYEARLELVGLAALADPLLQLVFPWIGRAAVQGLRARAAAIAEAARHAA